MSYTPINGQVFNAAYCGALAGMGASDRVPTSATLNAYAGLVMVAGAYAQEFDTLWNNAAPASMLDIYSIQQLTESVWQMRAPITNVKNITPSSYSGLCAALITMVLASEGYYAAQGITPPPLPGGGGGFPVSDAIFDVQHSTDITKQLNIDLAGSAVSTLITLASVVTANRTFRLPDQSGTAVVAADGTGLVLIGTTTQIGGSNAGIQYATTVSNRAALRCNQFGANGGIPGVVGFKSRGATIGALAAVIVGDYLWRATGIGVTGNNANIPLAGFISLKVAAVMATQIACDFEITQTNLAGVQRVTYLFNSEGDINQVNAGQRIRPKEGANAMQGVGVLDAGGSLTVANTLVGANTRIMYNYQDTAGAPIGSLYQDSRTPATSFVIKSTGGAADVGKTVAWQLWEPAP